MQWSIETYAFVAVLSLLISLLLLHVIISSATHAGERRKIAESQLKILASLARKMGIDEEQIKKDIGLKK